MSINLPYVEGTSEKIWCLLKSHKIRSTFCTESNLRKLLCEPTDRVATEDCSDQLKHNVTQHRLMTVHIYTTQ